MDKGTRDPLISILVFNVIILFIGFILIALVLKTSVDSKREYQTLSQQINEIRQSLGSNDRLISDPRSVISLRIALLHQDICYEIKADKYTWLSETEWKKLRKELCPNGS